MIYNLFDLCLIQLKFYVPIALIKGKNERVGSWKEPI